MSERADTLAQGAPATPAGGALQIPTGNTYDKYGSGNPVVKRLMAGFERSLDELLALARPTSILDIGCGEGVLTARWAERFPGRVVGIDLPDPGLQAHWQRRRRDNLDFQVCDVTRGLPFEDDEFDLVCATEVLEHVPEPARVVAEMARVAGRHLLASVPREPLWRMLNLARGSYVRKLGNTPGHLNHWSSRAFAGMLAQSGEVRALRAPLPWTMALVSVA